jgi:hypothetical protein
MQFLYWENSNKEKQEEKKEVIYSNMDGMLNRILYTEEKD